MDAISPAPPPIIKMTPITCRSTFFGDQLTAKRKIAPARMRKTLTPALNETSLPSQAAGRYPAASLALLPHDAAESQVRGGGIHRLALARGRPVAQAVVGGAQVRAPFDDPARYVGAGLTGNQAGLR